MALLILSLLSTLCILSATGGKLYGVIPEGYPLGHCTFEACHPLDYYARDMATYFTSDVTMIFLPGKHVLSGIYISVANVRYFTMIGDPLSNSRYRFPAYPVIQCHNESGFGFSNVSNMRIDGLSFFECTQDVPSPVMNNSTVRLRAGLMMRNVTDLALYNVTVCNSTGFGLLAQNILGYSKVEDCTFRGSGGSDLFEGGNVAIVYQESHLVNSTYLSIKSSNFKSGHNFYRSSSQVSASGLHFSINCSRMGALLAIEVEGVVMVGNQGREGGNLGIAIHNCHQNDRVRVQIYKCLISEGESVTGAGMQVDIDRGYSGNGSNSHNIHHLVSIEDTTFMNNVVAAAGAVYVSHMETISTMSQQLMITFINCMFIKNSAGNFYSVAHVGTAVLITNLVAPGTVPHIGPQLLIAFNNCTFIGNHLMSSKEHIASENAVGALHTDNTPSTLISNCTFADNTCAAIVSTNSILLLEGTVIIRNNTGGSGGGMGLYEQSLLFLKNHTTLELTDNYARYSGGGIFVQEDCLESRPACFYQIDSEEDWQLRNLKYISVEMKGNLAKASGNAIFGGSIPYCYMSAHLSSESYKLPDVSGANVFDTVFHVKNISIDPSAITSSAIGICFCDGPLPLNASQCNQRLLSANVYPGGYLQLSVVVVGQRLGTLPGEVLAIIEDSLENINVTFGNLHTRNWQSIDTTECKESNLRYVIHSTPGTSANITLQIRDSTSTIHNGSLTTLWVSVAVLNCPLGFSFSEETMECECNHALHDYVDADFVCNIRNLTIAAEYTYPYRNLWYGYSKESFQLSSICPFDFCNVNRPYAFTLNETNVQCSNGRTGIACGKCHEGYSKVLGSSECRKCSNYYLLLLVPFALAGLILVVIILACNLTVTEGTLSGFIFYANIYEINKGVLYRETHSKPFLPRILMAWLNLDLGIDVCFYDGMTASQKTWLQFVFPFYLWLLAGIFIKLSQYALVGRLVQRNGTKLLATMFLLSYT